MTLIMGMDEEGNVCACIDSAHAEHADGRGKSTLN